MDNRWPIHPSTTKHDYLDCFFWFLSLIPLSFHIANSLDQIQKLRAVFLVKSGSSFILLVGARELIAICSNQELTKQFGVRKKFLLNISFCAGWSGPTFQNVLCFSNSPPKLGLLSLPSITLWSITHLQCTPNHISNLDSYSSKVTVPGLINIFPLWILPSFHLILLQIWVPAKSI